jgi:hypothetical protein
MVKAAGVIKLLPPVRAILLLGSCLQKIPGHSGQRIRTGHLWTLMYNHRQWLPIGSFSAVYAEYPLSMNTSFILDNIIRQITSIPERLSRGCFLTAPYALGTKARQEGAVFVKARSGLHSGRL